MAVAVFQYIPSCFLVFFPLPCVPSTPMYSKWSLNTIKKQQKLHITSNTWLIHIKYNNNTQNQTTTSEIIINKRNNNQS